MNFHVTCAQTLWSTQHWSFFEENPRCQLSEIQFTSTDDAVVKAFVTEMTTRFREDPNFEHSSKVASEVSGKVKRKRRKEKKAAPLTPLAVTDNSPQSTQSNEMMSAEGLKVVVVPGDMTREEVSDCTLPYLNSVRSVKFRASFCKELLRIYEQS